jgi:hypothetical protein
MNLIRPCPNLPSRDPDLPQPEDRDHKCPLCVRGWILSTDGELFSELLQKRFEERIRKRFEKTQTPFKEAVLEAHKILDNEGIPTVRGEQLPPGVNSQLSARLKLFLQRMKEREKK